MSKSDRGAVRRLERLERVLAGRQERLASAIARQQSQATAPGPVGSLQRYGYFAAMVLALAAVLPTVVGFAFRRRKLLVGAAANGLALRTLQKRFHAARRAGSSR